MSQNFERSQIDRGEDSKIMAASSRFVSQFFEYMARQPYDWVVMNNYENLPRVIPSDIDMSISPELFGKLDRFLLDFSQSVGSRIIQKLWHGNMKCAYIFATGSIGEREFVQLDFFTDFSTKYCPALIAHADLVRGRRAFRNFFVPRPEVELLFTTMRRVFKDDWSTRHCARIAALRGRIEAVNYLPQRYVWLEKTVEAAIRGEVDSVASRRQGDWRRLRASAFSTLSLSEKITNALHQMRRIAIRLRDETGQIVALDAPRESFPPKVMAVLDTVFHRREILAERRGFFHAGKLALLKRRKGLVIIPAGQEEPKGRGLVRHLARLRLVDQLLYRDCATPPAGRRYGFPAQAFTSDSDVLEAIIDLQASKTAKAIARGGTQTSGAAKQNA